VISWQRRRVALNHDWLKNRYLPALGSWANVIDGRIHDSALEDTFESEVFRQWEVKRDEAFALIEAYPIEMSPRQLFNRPPLAHCKDPLKAVAAEVMHELWMFRHGVGRLVRVALGRVRAADLAYVNVCTGLGQRRCPPELSAWKQVRTDFLVFSRECRKLGRILARFQDEITVA
jgi:hypothetical protein